MRLRNLPRFKMSFSENLWRESISEPAESNLYSSLPEEVSEETNQTYRQCTDLSNSTRAKSYFYNSRSSFSRATRVRCLRVNSASLRMHSIHSLIFCDNICETRALSTASGENHLLFLVTRSFIDIPLYALHAEGFTAERQIRRCADVMCTDVVMRNVTSRGN